MMKRTFSLILILGFALFPSLLTASAQEDFSIKQREEWFPDKSAWTYHYIYQIPQILDDNDLAHELSYYFDGALNEMTKLVLPKYAADPIMKGDGANEVSDDYKVVGNNVEFFSVLVHHRQSMEGQVIYSLRSVVFASSGQYSGESLTLRGLAGEIGESSEQLAELVSTDVWRQISQQFTKVVNETKTDNSKTQLFSEFLSADEFLSGQSSQYRFLSPAGFAGDQS